MGTQARRLHLLLHLLLLEQQALGVEHVEVIGKPTLERHHCDVVGALGCGHRFGGEGLLLVHGLAADQLIGNALEGVHQCLVVVRHGDVITRRRLAQLRTQAPAVEDRQRDRRPDVVGELLARQELQRPTTGGHVAKATHQVDVGIKPGPGHIDAPGLGRHLPTPGNHIRTLAEQFGGQGRRQLQRRAEGQGRALQLRALSRPLAGQGRQLIAAQGDGFVQGVELAVGLGQWCLGLADFEMGADAAVQALVRQVENLLLLVEGRGDDIALGVVQRKLDVGAHDIALQFQLRLTRLSDTGMGQVNRPFAGIALAAPQVQGVAQAQGGIVVPGRGVGQFARAIELIGGPVMALEGRLAIDLQRLGGLGNTGHGLGLAHPRGGHGQARAVLHGQVNPAIQLPIAINLPPLASRPVGVASRLADGGIGRQLVGRHYLALRPYPACPDATADG